MPMDGFYRIVPAVVTEKLRRPLLDHFLIDFIIIVHDLSLTTPYGTIAAAGLALCK